MNTLKHLSPIERFRQKVLDPDLSVRSGVYSAINPALRMTMNARGEYEYMKINEQSSETIETLLKVSAFGEPDLSEDQFAAEAYPDQEEVTNHQVLGRYRGLYAGYAVEGDYREIGSSGGLATWLLVELLSTGRIDGAIHIVPGPVGGPLFQYRVSRTVEEVREGAKSRYYPGHLADVLNEIRQLEGRFAVTAIPSFAYEIRLLQRVRPEFAEKIAYVVGLVCGHQKTANYALNLAWHAGIKPEELEYIDFRKKDESKPANHYTTEFVGRVNGQRVQKIYGQDALFGNDWGLGMFKSNFSDFTEDAFNETADVVFGDAWLPQYTSDSRGTNIVITRHAELHQVLQGAATAGRLHIDVLTEQDALRSQTSLVRHCVDELPVRFDYLGKQNKYVPTRRRAGKGTVSFARRMVQIQRYEISQATHAAWIDAVEKEDLSAFDSSMEKLVRNYRWAQRFANIKQLPGRVYRKLQRMLSSKA